MTCRRNDATCECYLTIEHRLTMMNEKDRILLLPSEGKFRPFNDTEKRYSEDEEEEFIAGDGYGSRMVIAVNRRFPGPQITAYENQNIIVHMRNLMHTDSTTIHFHGIHQKRTPWSDGVAFVSQCPILPGQIYTYSFYAKPFGTSFYHAHIGDQRSAGLYGPLVIIPLSSVNISTPQDDNDGKVHTVAIQDWNHFDDPETLYQRMLFGTFDLQENKAIDTTSDISGANFSRYICHSGIINGKGRFYNTLTTHNQAPLTIYDVEPNTDYRFRVIGAATLYPFRVYIQDHDSIRIVASDGFEIEPIEVESLIIHPVAETLEVEPASNEQYHAAEAIIHYTNTKPSDNDLNPSKGSPNICTDKMPCKIFNCPYIYYPQAENRICLTWNDAKTIDPNSNIDEVKGVAIERFYNFAFPGENGYTPGSGQDQQDIICNDGKNFCNNAQWRNSTWSNGSHPTLNWDNPPQKDTIIVPTGAYVVIRFKADNPGLWFFHCHIDVHNTNGMGMMINESPAYHQKVPDDFPRCKSYIVNNNDGRFFIRNI
ncbi:unnamed protein product [Mytilus edulis]|uniref:Uncharacterized protein n=1 Tax=Mytilus edulis TaxID=6550 RepID=A0A8S3T5U8_MYTED|nr:unnamed protein product [Mytilus edulis]